MKIAIVGGTGSTGYSLLTQALARHHEVLAIVRTPAKLSLAHPQLQIMQGDILIASSLAGAFANCEVVISCVGVATPLQARKGTTIHSLGTQNIVAAMRTSSCRRLIVVSSAGVAPRKGVPLLYKLIVKPFFLEPAYRDMRLMEEFVRNTDLAWTIVRPPYLTDAPITPNYRLMADRNFDDDHSLPRASLAHFLLNEAESPHFGRHIVAVSG